MLSRKNVTAIQLETDLAIDSDRLSARVACAGEVALVAADAVGIVLTEHVLLRGQRLVTMPAVEVVGVILFAFHGAGGLVGKNELNAEKREQT